MAVDILELFRRNGIEAKRKTATEWCSPCPACGGRDRCLIWPGSGEGKGHYWCRGCSIKGDGIQFLRDFCGFSYQQACSELGLPARPGFKRPVQNHGGSSPLGELGRAGQEPNAADEAWERQRLGEPQVGASGRSAASLAGEAAMFMDEAVRPLAGGAARYGDESSLSVAAGASAHKERNSFTPRLNFSGEAFQNGHENSRLELSGQAARNGLALQWSDSVWDERANPPRLSGWLGQPRAEVWSGRESGRSVIKPRTRAEEAAGLDRALWREKAAIFTEWCHERIWETPEALAWLERRGLGREAVSRYRLGWNPGEGGRGGLLRSRGGWGLPETFKEDGTLQRLWLPRGLVIPHLEPDWSQARLSNPEGKQGVNQSGNRGGQMILRRLRVRRPEEERARWASEQKYYVVPGSEMEALHLPCLNAEGFGAVVVESELDAMLLHSLAGDLCCVLACLSSGSAALGPELFQNLMGAKRILVALDFDQPDRHGHRAGARGAERWLNTFPQARRHPPVGGKDPGEAYQNGEDLRLWLLAGFMAANPEATSGHPLEGRENWESSARGGLIASASAGVGAGDAEAGHAEADHAEAAHYAEAGHAEAGGTMAQRGVLEPHPEMEKGARA